MKLTAGDIVDRYLVEELVGEGGFSWVFRVRHRTLGTRSALKLLKIGRPGMHEQLVREGQLQARLAHPNILAVRDVVSVGDRPGLVLDLVEGGTMRELIRTRPLSAAELWSIGADLIEAVAAAHRIGLIHRDLKPTNILIAHDHDRRIVPKIADFGLATVVREARVAYGTGIVGTPNYLAPEQIGEPDLADAKTDLFSLGTVLYELVTGHRAFEGESPRAILLQLRRAQYRPVRELRPDLPQSMVDAIESALVLPRRRRIESARALADRWSDGSRSELALRVHFGAPATDAGATLIPTASRWLASGDRRRLRRISAILGVAAVIAVILGLVATTGSSTEAPARVAALSAAPISDGGPTSAARARSPAVVSEAPEEDEVEQRWMPERRREEPRRSLRQSAPPRSGPPVPEPPRTATVSVTGDAERIILIRRVDGRRVLPGPSVPPGLYDLAVWFPDEADLPVALGLRVEPGRTFAIRCDGDFYRCWLDHPPDDHPR